VDMTHEKTENKKSRAGVPLKQYLIFWDSWIETYDMARKIM
jgi:hypothetical protein